MIYILHATGGGPIKIGNSYLPEHRKSGVGQLFPYGVDLLAKFDGEWIGEKFLHLCFRPLSTTPEWFIAGPAIWRFIIDAIDNGRPSWLPIEERMRGDDILDIAVEIFGDDRKRIMRELGFSPFTTFKDTFSASSASSHSIQAKVLFAKAIRDGSLPPYIADLHRPADLLEAAE